MMSSLGLIVRRILPLAILASGLAFSGAHSEEVTFDLRVIRGQVPPNMRLIRVRQGDVVTLRWRSDRATVLHLHGYDIERKVEPSGVTEMVFTAHATGRFAVSEHQPQAGGGHTHGDSIVRVEVLPR
jgi:hypothetical protein